MVAPASKHPITGRALARSDFRGPFIYLFEHALVNVSTHLRLDFSRETCAAT